MYLTASQASEHATTRPSCYLNMAVSCDITKVITQISIPKKNFETFFLALVILDVLSVEVPCFTITSWIVPTLQGERRIRHKILKMICLIENCRKI